MFKSDIKYVGSLSIALINLLMHKCNYAVTRTYLANRTISIFILTEGCGPFINIVFIMLFLWLCMWFYIFYILIKLLNNELVGKGGYKPVVGPSDPGWT
jgi:hypothetical protein